MVGSVSTAPWVFFVADRFNVFLILQITLLSITVSPSQPQWETNWYHGTIREANQGIWYHRLPEKWNTAGLIWIEGWLANSLYLIPVWLSLLPVVSLPLHSDWGLLACQRLSWRILITLSMLMWMHLRPHTTSHHFPWCLLVQNFNGIHM